MAQVGDAILTFGGETLTKGAGTVGCLQDISYAVTADEVGYLCGGYHVNLPGATTAVLSATVAIESDAVSFLTILRNGTVQTDFDYKPFGTTVGDIVHTSDASVAFGFEESNAINNIILVSFKIAVHNPVTAAIA